MNRQRVISSNIGSIGYDSAIFTLEVEFLNGSIYQYFGVPEQLFKQLMVASSHGTFFSHFIKKSYNYVRIF
jgi:hypothetical protein